MSNCSPERPRHRAVLGSPSLGYVRLKARTFFSDDSCWLSLLLPLPPHCGFPVPGETLGCCVRPARPSCAGLAPSQRPPQTGSVHNAVCPGPPGDAPLPWALGRGGGSEHQGGERSGWKSFQESLSTLMSRGPRALTSFWCRGPGLGCHSARRRGHCGSCPFGWARDDSHRTFWLRHGSLDLALITSLLGHDLCVQVCNRAPGL